MFFHGSWLLSQSFSSPGYSHVQIPDDWFIQAPSHSLVLQTLETVVHLCQDHFCFAPLSLSLCGGRHLSGPSQPSSQRLFRSFGCGVGCSPPGRNRFWPLVSGGNTCPQCKGASCGGVRSTVLPSSGSQLHCSGLFRQLDLLGQSLQTGEHSISNPQFH